MQEDRLALLLGRARAGRPLHGRASSSSEPGCRPRRCSGSAACSGCPRPARRTACSARRRSRRRESTRLFLDAGLGEEAIAEITRVLGEGMARLAATTAAAFVDAFLEAGRQRGRGRAALRRGGRAADPGDRPGAGRGLQAAPARGVRRGILGRAEREAGEAGRRAGDRGVLRRPGRVHAAGRRRSSPEELGSLASKLAELANEVTEPPVRLVKTIGDAAMFVSPEPGAARGGRAVAVGRASRRRSCRACAPGWPRPRAAARRRLLRPRGQPGQPGDRRGAPRQRAVHRGGPRRRARPVRLVVRRAGTS